MMSDQLFNDSSTVGTTAEIPDIFDVLEGGEDEGAVRYLLGFNGEEASVGLLGQVDSFGGMEVIDKYVGEGIALPLNGTNFVPSVTVANAGTPTITVKSPVTLKQVANSANSKKRDTSGAKAIHNCDSCGKSFTTKFNLKRHINMHCHKSKENGIPIQGPPSASAPAKKSETKAHKGERQQEAKENSKTVVTTVAPQTVLAPNQTIIQRPNVIPVPYTRVVTVPQTEYQRPEPDSTYKLPSVQTILPVSVYTTSTTIGTTSYSTITSCDSSQPVPSVTSSSHNTDYGTLPADLFDPDSSQSQPPSPASPAIADGAVILANSKDHVTLSAVATPVIETTKTVAVTMDGSSPQPVTLTSVPSGWTRKLSPDTGRVIFISPLGKVFTCHDEIVQYFRGFHFSVPLGLFDFDPRYLESSEDEDESEDDEDEDDEDYDEECEGEQPTSFCAKRRRSDVTVLQPPATAAVAAPGFTPSNSPLASSPDPGVKEGGCEEGAALYHPVPQSSVKSHQSQTYLTYIQGLRLGSDTMCDWTRELESTETLLSTDHPGTLYLPATVVTAATASTGVGIGVGPAAATNTPWLQYLQTADSSSSTAATSTATTVVTAGSAADNSNVTNGVNSLCALRDFMIQEALNVVKFA